MTQSTTTLTFNLEPPWSGSIGSVHMGCCLETSALMTHGFAAWRSVRQVHGNHILDDHSFLGPSQEADGLVSDRVETLLLIKTADCVPVHATDGRRIALLHAGWRGTEAGILERLSEFFTPADLHVAIGPCISGASYEVDADLYGAWSDREPALDNFLDAHRPGSTKRLFDIGGLVAHQLVRMGVPAKHITRIPVDTFTSTLPSYRRDGLNAARIFNYIYRIG